MVGQLVGGVTVQGGNKTAPVAAAAPVAEAKRKNTYRQDPEMGAMVKVDHILKSLDPASANRVLNWVTAKVQERGRAAHEAAMAASGAGRLAAVVPPHPAETF